MDAGKKIVSIADFQKTISIDMGSKVFDISRVVLKATQRYGEYLIFYGKYVTEVSEINKQIDDQSISTGALSKLQDKMTKMIEDFAIEKAQRIEELLKIILEKNGYEYSREWWEENADYQSMEMFIVTAMKKDDVEGSIIKKKEMNSTSIA